MQFEVDMLAPGAERIIGTDHRLDVIANDVVFGEGPVWDQRSRQFFFTDICGDTIWKCRPGARPEIVLQPSAHANGMCMDREGQVAGGRLGRAHGVPLRKRRVARHAGLALRGQEDQQPERHRRALGRPDLFHRFAGRHAERRHGGRRFAEIPRHPGRVSHHHGRRTHARHRRFRLSERLVLFARREAALRELQPRAPDPRL